MIEICYDTEKENMFDLRYKLKEYIPESIYSKYPIYTELYFIQELFDRESDIELVDNYQLIWSTHFEYKYLDKRFLLLLDEDYSFISYAVNNPKDKKEVAEHICKLIENSKLLYG